MALFGGKESKEDKAARKEQELLEKYGLENISRENVDSVKKIINELVGTGMMETGLKLSMSGKVEDVLPVYYQRAILEQNWIIIRQLDRITQLLEK